MEKDVRFRYTSYFNDTKIYFDEYSSHFWKPYSPHMRSLVELGVQTSKKRIQECRKYYAEWATKHDQENAKGIPSPVDTESSSEECGSSESNVVYVSHVFDIPSEAPPL